ncbi:MAG: STAS domain-containing protein [Lachnospiraceae bacterium]|nr:STAS domain-containing protein [Lachnospiraceae bacterium]
MLRIDKNVEGEVLNVSLKGRLDITTAPGLEEDMKASITGITSLVFDITELDYISSAGLRVLLSCQKIMSKQGSMVVKNPTEEVKEIFDITGFSDILTIE